jgi:23S rRNA (cytidine1920-2'-O)/16S rRNA (cytidine1409-2'-O)-methyltransferase
LVPSRDQAQELVTAGRVLVGGAPATKASRLVGSDEAVVLQGDPPRFVSRGGEKLDAALTQFGIDVTGRRALDAGSSTGGFTDCLLQRGAKSVVAVDVGRAQLHERLRADPRVRVMERTNIRGLTLADLGADGPDGSDGAPSVPFEIVVADLSFISLRLVAAALVDRLAGPGADVVLLIKPQFEAGREAVSKGRGVIRDPEIWTEALTAVLSELSRHGAAMMGVMVSPLRGADGNVEFLAHLRAHTRPETPPETQPPADRANMIAAAVEHATE